MPLDRNTLWEKVGEAASSEFVALRRLAHYVAKYFPSEIHARLVRDAMFPSIADDELIELETSRERWEVLVSKADALGLVHDLATYLLELKAPSFERGEAVVSEVNSLLARFGVEVKAHQVYKGIPFIRLDMELEGVEQLLQVLRRI